VVLEWDPVQLATADLISLALYRNDQKAGNIPRPLALHSTKISGLAVDTEYAFHLVLRTSAGTYASKRIEVRTHKMTDLSGITIATGIMPASVREGLARAVERIGAKMVDGVRIDTTHFVTMEGRGLQWEKAVEMNIPVVRPDWVEACERNGRIIGVTKFYLDVPRPPPGSDERTASNPAAAPSSEQPSAAAASQKDLPDTPPPEAEPAAAAQKKDEAVDGDDESDDETDEDEEQAKSAVREEQKVRLDEKDGQKVALRPGSSSRDGPAAGEESGADDAKDEKPGTPGDNASFQDVAL